MSEPDFDTRFDGLRRLYGARAYALLPRLRVCVVGVGGVGSWAVEALARSAVGAISMIDYDTVAGSNFNRQIQALEATLGRKKILALAERVVAINPRCVVEPVDDYITLDNLAGYLERDFDYVLDAIDSIKFKAGIIYHCRRNKIPVLTTGGAGGRSDPTRIKVADLSRTYNDPLAAKVRARLRDDYGYTRNPKRYFGVECVFSTEQPVYPKPDGSVSTAKPGIHGVHLDCRFGYGTSSAVTAMVGFTAAARVIRKALQRRLAPNPEAV